MSEPLLLCSYRCQISIVLFSKTRLKYYFNTAHLSLTLFPMSLLRVILQNRRSIIIYTHLSPAITCSSLPALQHSTSLHATSCHLPRLSIRGSRPICFPAVLVQFAASQFSSNLSAVLPFIVVTVPGVHHLLSLIQCSFHVFKTTFPIPLTFFHPLPVLSISNAVHSHLPFFTIHAAFVYVPSLQ